MAIISEDTIMDINAAATQIVDRHVFCYVTELIKTLAEGHCSDLPQDILEMREKAIALRERGAVSFWAVSDWLRLGLEDAGELVDADFYGLCVWARKKGVSDTALQRDSAILKIAKEYIEGQ
jgi:hypothetical protein